MTLDKIETIMVGEYPVRQGTRSDGERVWALRDLSLALTHKPWGLDTTVNGYGRPRVFERMGTRSEVCIDADVLRTLGGSGREDWEGNIRAILNRKLEAYGHHSRPQMLVKHVRTVEGDLTGDTYWSAKDVAQATGTSYDAIKADIRTWGGPSSDVIRARQPGTAGRLGIYISTNGLSILARTRKKIAAKLSEFESLTIEQNDTKETFEGLTLDQVMRHVSELFKVGLQRSEGIRLLVSEIHRRLGPNSPTGKWETAREMCERLSLERRLLVWIGHYAMMHGFVAYERGNIVPVQGYTAWANPGNLELAYSELAVSQLEDEMRALQYWGGGG